jgi:outer membrane lipoprotein carrier protein
MSCNEGFYDFYGLNDLNDFEGSNHLTNRLFDQLTFCAMRYALWAFVAFVAFPTFAVHSAGSSSELIEKIQKKYEETRSLKADFTQKTRSKAASMGTSARGRLFFLKPRAIRWDYEQPRQQFVINEDKAWLYVPEEKTIYLYDADQIINSPVVLSFFSGLGQLGEMFSITQLPSEPGPPPRYRLLLLPREADSPVSQITLWVDPRSYQVVGIQTEDPLGNINEITFSNIQVNPPLDPSWFALEVPEGVRLERQEAIPTQ